MIVSVTHHHHSHLISLGSELDLIGIEVAEAIGLDLAAPDVDGQLLCELASLHKVVASTVAVLQEVGGVVEGGDIATSVFVLCHFCLLIVQLVLGQRRMGGGGGSCCRLDGDGMQDVGRVFEFAVCPIMGIVRGGVLVGVRLVLLALIILQRGRDVPARLLSHTSILATEPRSGGRTG